MARHDDMPRHDDPTEIEPRPSPPLQAGQATNTAQLRQAIDSGATGDKAGMLDPASSPLGTDAEASGVSPTPEAVAAAHAAERMAQPPPADPGERSGIGLGPVLLLVVLGAAGLGVAAMFLG